MNIIRYSIRSFFTNEYYSIIRFASKRLFVATLIRSPPANSVLAMSPTWTQELVRSEHQIAETCCYFRI